MSIEINLNGVSKRFKRDWIFRSISYQFNPGSRTALLGSNGSGKSTLLKIIAGYVGSTEGTITWKSDEQTLEEQQWHQHISLAAPYLECILEYSLKESIDFHFSLKNKRTDIDINEVLEKSGLANHLHKNISQFSSGMMQRLKLILALGSDVDVYLLDEPCSNLDDAGIEWYQNLVNGLPDNKTVIVASNTKVEYYFCEDKITVSDFA